MTARRTWRRTRLAAIAMPIAAVAVGCVNASGGSYSLNVDRHNPSAVVQSAVQTLFSWQPGVDDSPVDAFDRARPLMSVSLAAQELSLTTADAGTQWQQWASDVTDTTFDVGGLADCPGRKGSPMPLRPVLAHGVPFRVGGRPGLGDVT